MALSTEDDDGNAANLIREAGGKAVAKQLAAREEGRRMADFKKYKVIEQLFDGHRTLERGEVVSMRPQVAEKLSAYLVPVDDQPAEEPVQKAQNRMVSTEGASGPTKKA